MTKPVALFPCSDQGCERMFKEMGFDILYPSNVKTSVVDLVVFVGGADVCPFLYGETSHPTTVVDLRRDRADIRAFKKYYDLPKVGICRGGQFLNVMSGGSMWQNVDKHNLGYHEVYDATSEDTITVSSTHHQMMIPGGDGITIAWAQEAEYCENDNTKVYRTIHDEDAEVVYYDSTKSLCFQPHPEFNDKKNDACREWFKSLVNVWITPDIEERQAKRNS